MKYEKWNICCYLKEKIGIVLWKFLAISFKKLEKKALTWSGGNYHRIWCVNIKGTEVDHAFFLAGGISNPKHTHPQYATDFSYLPPFDK